MTDYNERLMQIALTQRGNLFDFLRYSSVPNVSYGLLHHGEADLICMSKSHVFHEVEIKVRKSDIRADFKKRYRHDSVHIKYAWFAVPENLEEFALSILPSRFGLVVVFEKTNRFSETKLFTRIVRRPKKNEKWAASPSNETIIKFLRLGVLRMWSESLYTDTLRKAYHKLVEENKVLCQKISQVDSMEQSTLNTESTHTQEDQWTGE
jgi:hypothetical protein